MAHGQRDGSTPWVSSTRPPPPEPPASGLSPSVLARFPMPGNASRPGRLAALVRHGAELAVRMLLARITLRRLLPADIDARNAQANRAVAGLASGAGRTQEITAAGDDHDPAPPIPVRRAAKLAPGLGRVLPWRADCLVQAIAVQRYLSARQLPSRIVVGLDRDAAGQLESHAWLTWQDTVILGGAVDRYAVILGALQDGRQDGGGRGR